MNNLEIIAQITGFIAWLLLIYSYYKEEINELLFVQIIASIFDCISYFLLGAYSGLIVCIIELLKGIGYYKTDKDNYIFLITLPIYILIGILTSNGLISLLPVIASIIDGFSLTKNKTTATIGGIISNMLWLIYDFVVLAYISAISDSIFILSNTFLLLCGYSILLKTNKLRIVPARRFNRSIYNSIYKLDKTTYGEEYAWTYEYEKQIHEKNKNSIVLIKYYNEIIGYITFYILNETEYNKLINSDKMYKEYNLDNINYYNKRQKNYILIDSINIKKKFQNKISINLITKKIKKIIIQIDKEGYKIENIISPTINTYEREILENIGLTKYKEYNKNEFLYIMNKHEINERYIKPARELREKRKYKVYYNKEISLNVLEEIKSLDESFFDKEYLWDTKQQIDIFNKNKNSIIAVTYENKLIGYINYLVITKEKYKEILNSDITIDSYELKDICKFYKNQKNYITINSVVIDKKYQNGYTIKLLTKNFKKILKKLDSNKYNISGINAITISKDGEKFLESLGFKKLKTLKDNNNLYLLEEENLKKYLK